MYRFAMKKAKKKEYTVKFVVPDYVQKVARMLAKEGYQCYLVGGAVRDIVMGIEPDDWDLATDALPEEMLKIFPKSVATGAKFGMVMALVPDKHGERFEVEVTTFRSEENYVDGRWPSDVKFEKEIDKDLGRRDFTWNAMALDLNDVAQNDGGTERKEWKVYDPFDGLTDLGLKVVRAVGTPIERFKEDGLRAFRACRLASQLGFDIEENTFEAIKKAIPVAKMVSKERIRDEFMKTLMKSSKPSRGLEYMRRTGLMKIFLPELLEGVGVEQKLFHYDTVYWHNLRTCDIADDKVKLSALFHDIGKPRKDTKDGHFYGHAVVGESMVRKIMKRLRFSKSDIERVALLVKNHMFYFPYYKENMDDHEKQNLDVHKWTDSAVRRFIVRVGEENVDDLFALRIADAGANPKSAFDPTEIEQLEARISEVRKKDMAFKVTDLAVNGDDLLALGVPKGPEVGRVLQNLFDLVTDDPLLNTKAELLKRAAEVIGADNHKL